MEGLIGGLPVQHLTLPRQRVDLSNEQQGLPYRRPLDAFGTLWLPVQRFHAFQ